jgi:hypothetical protein
MKRILVVLLIAVFAAIGLAAQDQPAGGEKEKKVSAAKLERWSGSIVRTDTDASTLTVRNKNTRMEKIIHYTSATNWTKKGGGTVDASALKEGDVVVCHGKLEGDKFVAVDISVRTK